MHAPTSPVDPLEIVKARAAYSGALRELDHLRDVLHKAGRDDAHLHRAFRNAEERAAHAAARLAALRRGA